jgi:hypothetical protein
MKIRSSDQACRPLHCWHYYNPSSITSNSKAFAGFGSKERHVPVTANSAPHARYDPFCCMHAWDVAPWAPGMARSKHQLLICCGYWSLMCLYAVAKQGSSLPGKINICSRSRYIHKSCSRGSSPDQVSLIHYLTWYQNLMRHCRLVLRCQSRRPWPHSYHGEEWCAIWRDSTTHWRSANTPATQEITVCITGTL